MIAVACELIESVGSIFVAYTSNMSSGTLAQENMEDNTSLVKDSSGVVVLPASEEDITTVDTDRKSESDEDTGADIVEVDVTSSTHSESAEDCTPEASREHGQFEGLISYCRCRFLKVFRNPTPPGVVMGSAFRSHLCARGVKRPPEDCTPNASREHGQFEGLISYCRCRFLKVF